MILLHLIVLTLAALGAWYVSRYDSKLTGENPGRDLARRLLRCGLTLVLVEIAQVCLMRWSRYSDPRGGYIFLVLMLPLAWLWVGCLSDFFGERVHRLFDSQDDRAADIHKHQRDMDQLAFLVQQGKREEAIAMCQQLKASGEASGLAMETMLARLGVAHTPIGRPMPLAEIRRLVLLGRHPEAETKLQAMLAKAPGDQAVGLQLMRLYAEEMKQPDKAVTVLETFRRQPYVPAAFLDYASRSIHEWCQATGTTPPADRPLGGARPESGPDDSTEEGSIDKLLADGYLGTAIEQLEQKIKAQPRNFELWMKLAEAHGRHCSNFGMASKIVERIEADPAFSPAQVVEARTRLDQWRQASHA